MSIKKIIVTKGIYQDKELRLLVSFMDFSLLSTSEFFVFRKMEMGETKNHLLCGWVQKCL